MTRVFIYALKDPHVNELFYVGKTIQPKIRFIGHISASKYQRNAREKRIYSLISKCTLPIMEILEECHESIANNREKFWINHLAMNGNNLMNSKHHAGRGGKKTRKNIYHKIPRKINDITLRILNRNWTDMNSLELSDLTGIKKSVVEFILNNKELYG